MKLNIHQLATKALLGLFVSVLVMSSHLACAKPISKSNEPASADFLWLEEVEGTKALGWVSKQNERTLKSFEKDPLFGQIQSSVLDILNAKDKIPYGEIMGDHVYNFWQDDKHVKGVWRRQSLEAYVAKSNEWEVMLDFDALSASMNFNIVFKGSRCLGPKYQRCLVRLSDGGKDAVRVLEFDTKSKSFVKDGFTLKESKTTTAWVDENTIAVGTDFGPSSMTDSGYARIVKLWKRQQPLASATKLFEGRKEDTWVVPYVDAGPEGSFLFLERGIDFFHKDVFLVVNQQPLLLPLPKKVEIRGVFKGHLVVQLNETWQQHQSGSLLALPLAPLNTPNLTSAQVFLKDPKVIFKPTASKFLTDVKITPNHLVLGFLEDVKSSVERFQLKGEAFVSQAIGEPKDGMIQVIGGNGFSELMFLTSEDFLTPDAVYLYDAQTNKSTKLRGLPQRFASDDLVVEQFFVDQKGTKVPYFVIRQKNLKFDGKNPTLLYGYGGFEISMTPSYSGVIGKAWLERGGVYVLSNIRGGGEYGPSWHDQALKHQRQVAYDDFYAITRELFAKNITSPKHLGIMGGSNGGLLMGVAFTQHPEYYQAVVCAVPLLDMMRFHKLLAGASWMGEYGNPDLPEDRKALLKFSPFQNLKKSTSYPEVLFVTSTKDDRVHPGHARKMAAKMLSLGHPVYYYENTQGGHSASANNLERARKYALEYTYLAQKLMGQKQM